jgi:hypothetical protein
MTTYADDRATFLRLIDADFPEDICDYCRVIDEVPAVVRYGENLYCSVHAYSELVLDLGRHGSLALPALAFSGADRTEFEDAEQTA